MVKTGSSKMTTRSHHKHFIAGGLVLAGALALAGCASMGGKSTSTLPPADAYAQLTDSKGADRGRADIYRDGSGLRIEQIGRASGRERVCQDGEISVVAVSFKQKKN